MSVANPRPADRDRAAPDNPSAQERVLIVDDDVDFGESIGDLLSLHGYSCAVTHSVAEFTLAVTQFKPQVALIDNRLGIESGITLLETIAEDYSDIVPIMMTGLTGADVAVEALRNHAYDYLRKPIDPEDLLASLSRAFEKQKLIGEREGSERALIASEEKFSKAFVSSPVPIAIVSLLDRSLVDVNDAFEVFSGYRRKDVANRSLNDLHLLTSPGDEESLMSTIHTSGSLRDRELLMRTFSGNVRECTVSAEVATIKNTPCTIVAIKDQTQERQAKQELAKSERRFRSLYDAMPAVFLTLDENGRLKSINSYGARELGYEADAIVGSSIRDHVTDGCKSRQREFISGCFADPSVTHVEEICFIRNGRSATWLRETAQVTPGAEGGTELLIVCEDITIARELSQKLSFEASHDALTGLVNRGEFERRLERVLESAKKATTEHMLCYLDLDQFKVVNDTCGHVAGDELLRQVCKLLQECVRKRDTLARVGGDEFAILMEDCDIEQTCRVCTQIHDAMKRFRFSWDDKTFSVGVGIGMVPVDGFFSDIKDVLSAADSACYEAKDKGTNRQHIYRSDDADLARQHGEIQWVSKIGDAIDNNRFELYRQTIEPLQSSGAAKRVEILLKMRSEDGTLISPIDFLPAAERYELAPRIDEWVMENTFDRILGNRKVLGDDVNLVSINISGRSLGDERFTSFVESLFARGGVPASMICFEITETAAIKHLVNATRFISTFKSRGCSFALDDFGAGLSSFAYLRNLHVDYIKIDGQLIRGMGSDPLNLAIVKSINEIGKVMGKTTIAEFVQTQQEFEIVKEIGIDYAQGSYVAKPVLLTAE